MTDPRPPPYPRRQQSDARTVSHKLYKPSDADLAATAADLRRNPNPVARAHAAQQALPAHHRSQLKFPGSLSPADKRALRPAIGDEVDTAQGMPFPWPHSTDLQAWRGLGASHAFSLREQLKPGNPDKLHPCELAYYIGYIAVYTGHTMPDQHTESPAAIQGYKPPVHPLNAMEGLLAKYSQQFGVLLKADKREQSRFIAEVIQVCRAKPELLNTAPESFVFAVAEAASMGLSLNPNLGECWLIPRSRSYKEGNDWHKIWETNFQPGYKGLIKLAHRSQLINSIYVDVAYAGEEYKRTGGTRPDIDHVPEAQWRTGKGADIVEAYAVVWLRGSNRPTFAAVTHRELEGIASQASHKGPWHTGHYAEMAKKTALIRVCKLLPRADELRGLHIVVERDLQREAGKEPTPTRELEQFHEALDVEAPHSDEAGA